MGNGTTLSSSYSVWQKLINNAQARGCFFDVNDDKDLSNAVAKAVIELDDAENSVNMESLQISRPRFQVLKLPSTRVRCSVEPLLDGYPFGYEIHAVIAYNNCSQEH